MANHADPATRLPIYLDHHATTPVDPRVVEVMIDALRHEFGNPNSVQHVTGRRAAAAIDRARAQVAALVGVEPDQVRFTQGASDSIAQAFSDALRRQHPRKVAVMPVEHPAMLNAIAGRRDAGDLSTFPLRVDHRAQLEIDSVQAALDDGADLVCVMAANNEVGTIYPLIEVLALCEVRGAMVLIDATQAAGRIDLAGIGPRADYLILSSHKIYGPKGVGALITRRPDDNGSGDHRGTPNVPAIIGFGEAARIARDEREKEWHHAGGLRDRLEATLVAAIPDLVVNGDRAARLPHSLHISVPNVENEAIVARIGDRVAISTGSACASGALEPSPVLQAMALPGPLIEGALRLSTGRFNTAAEVDEAVSVIVDAISAFRTAHKKGLTS